MIGQWPLILDGLASLLPVARFLLQLLLRIALSLTSPGGLPVLQPVRTTSQTTVTQSVTGISDNIFSVTAVAIAYSDSDSELQGHHTFPVYPQEEEVSVRPGY